MAGERKLEVKLWSGSWAKLIMCLRSAETTVNDKYPDEAPIPKRVAGKIVADINRHKSPETEQIDKAIKLLRELKQDAVAGGSRALFKKVRSAVDAAEYDVGQVPYWSGARFWKVLDEIERQCTEAGYLSE